MKNERSQFSKVTVSLFFVYFFFFLCLTKCSIRANWSTLGKCAKGISFRVEDLELIARKGVAPGESLIFQSQKNYAGRSPLLMASSVEAAPEPTAHCCSFLGFSVLENPSPPSL